MTAQGLDRTDVGNACLLAELAANRLKFDPARGWAWWDGSIWRFKRSGAVQEAIRATECREQRASELDLEERRRELAWVWRSRQEPKIRACLALAESLPAFKAPRWDAEPYLVTVANGTIDLRTGTLLPFDPYHYITHASPASYLTDASAPRWRRFVEEVFPNHEVRAFVHRAAGYSLTGDTSEQVFFLLFGTGANGKSKFLSGLRWALGPACHTSPFSAFVRRPQGSIPNDLAAMAGKRLVMALEVDENAVFDEARLKSITGGDEVSARFMHREFFEFTPVLKLWLVVNNLPDVTDYSPGFWRRVLAIPFTQRFDPSKERDLEQVFAAERDGILAWLVEGCMEWQRVGLCPPEAVLRATADYQSASDPLAEFLSERCDLGADSEESATALYLSYTLWAVGAGIQPRDVLSKHAFGKKLRARFDAIRRSSGVFYQGLRLVKAA